MNSWAQRFYKSRAWRQLRALVIERDNSVCAHCGEVILASPEVHHTIELTEENVRDPAISLNPELLKTLHHECHDAIHGRFGSASKDVIVDADLNIDYTRR